MREAKKIKYYALAGLSVAAPCAIALEPSDVLIFSKGPVSLRPQLSVSEVYNDNVYFRDENKRDDFITTVSPGFNLQVGDREFNFINLGFFYDRVIHLQESDQSANQYRIALENRFQKGKFTLAGRDEIEFLSSVLGGGISLRGVRVDRTTFFDEYRLTYEMTDKTGVYLEGTHSTIDYQDDLALYDANTLIGTGGFQYKAFDRLWFFGELFYGQTALSPNFGLVEPPHTSFLGGFAGARGFFTERLSGTAKAGYETREAADQSTGLPVVEMSLTQKFTENNSLTVSYSRRQRVSVQFARSEYTMNLASVTFAQIIGSTGRFRMNVDGAYGVNDYEPSPSYSKRTDELITGGIVFSYDFKIWLRGSLGYNYERLRSDLARIEDYDVNRVTLGLTVGY